jgi:hypothetical protein
MVSKWIESIKPVAWSGTRQVTLVPNGASPLAQFQTKVENKREGKSGCRKVVVFSFLIGRFYHSYCNMNYFIFLTSEIHIAI